MSHFRVEKCWFVSLTRFGRILHYIRTRVEVQTIIFQLFTLKSKFLSLYYLIKKKFDQYKYSHLYYRPYRNKFSPLIFSKFSQLQHLNYQIQSSMFFIIYLSFFLTLMSDGWYWHIKPSKKLYCLSKSDSNIIS
jgi:hypothetical protein